MINKLRPYQREVARAVLQSVFEHRGRTFSVEIARQGGKNELSAQLELLLLTLNMGNNQNLIKCAPSFKPQALISMMRLKEQLNNAGFAGIWTSEMGYIIRLGQARAVFLSADEKANVVGNTAHLLLEIDESQDVSKEKYSKEFKPMGATTNVTVVHYGTTWDDATLLEEMKQTNLELERRDGIKRHFRYDWQDVAKHNDDYLAYVTSERERLGEDHPLFMTQYRLLPISGGGGFFDGGQLAQLQGEHLRRKRPEKGRIYIAGIDIAGEAEVAEDAMLRAIKPHKDSTVLTIGELDFGGGSITDTRPQVRIVEHYWWTGRKHSALYAKLVDLIKNVWCVHRLVVDATGVGQPVYSFLRRALGSRVIPYTFTAQSKSELAFRLLAAVNSGRLKMYCRDSSPEYTEFWYEMGKAESNFRPNRTMDFYVPEAQGHDDFMMSLALLVEASRDYKSRAAKGSIST